jgi:hypothetical protein
MYIWCANSSRIHLQLHQLMQVSSGRGMDDMRAVGQSSILQVLQGNIERAQLEINMGKERN